MPTKLPLDPELQRLVEEAVKIGPHETADEAVDTALREYIQQAHRAIEECLELHERVEECCVVPDGDRLKVIVKLKGTGLQANSATNDPGLQRELLEHCRQRLTRFELPDAIAFTDSALPRLENKRIDREAVRRSFRATE